MGSYTKEVREIQQRVDSALATLVEASSDLAGIMTRPRNGDEERVLLLIDEAGNMLSDARETLEEITRTGPGIYKVTVVPPSDGPLEGVSELRWHCNHRLHAINKAKKRNLVVHSIELVEELNS